MAYSPQSEKVGGHVPRVSQQITTMVPLLLPLQAVGLFSLFLLSTISVTRDCRVDSETSHKNCWVIGLQARVNVKSNKISHFSYVFFATKWHPKCYKMVPD